MKKPNVFLTVFGQQDSSSERPKLGLDWFLRRGKRFKPEDWKGLNVYVDFFGYAMHLTFTDNSQKYADDFTYKAGPEWTWSLLPAKASKPRDF